MSAPLLELRALCGGYDPIQIFQNVDLVIEEGQTIGLFGPNGHGKTTLMKTISGVLEPWSGDVIFAGEQLNRTAARGSRRFRNFNYSAILRRRMDPKIVARAGLIHVAQGNLIFPEMTVSEVLSIAPLAARGRVTGAGPNRSEIHALFPRLAERSGSKIRYLSGGERQMVSIAAGLLAAPRLLILDEPTLGLSPKLRIELAASIFEIKTMGVPMIIIDQDVAFLTRLIDRLYLFDHGRISQSLDRADIPDHDTLMAMLFGEALTI